MTDKFNPQSKVTKMQGKDYLEVKWRIVWFRTDHPKGSIITEVVNDDLMKATIIDGDGRVLATGHGSSKKMGVAKNRPFEGAETAAIGRALAHAGYGTQFTDELDEGDHLADSPIERDESKDDERKTLARQKLDELIQRGNAVGVKVEPFGNDWGIEKMRAHYKEQEKFVKAAEEQAKAGE